MPSCLGFRFRAVHNELLCATGAHHQPGMFLSCMTKPANRLNSLHNKAGTQTSLRTYSIRRPIE